MILTDSRDGITVIRLNRSEGHNALVPAFIESLVEQYTSMVKEKSVADKSRKDADFFNTYQSSQMIASTVAPGVKPAYEQDELDFGDWS